LKDEANASLFDPTQAHAARNGIEKIDRLRSSLTNTTKPGSS
jgi:hypothetical protein